MPDRRTQSWSGVENSLWFWRNVLNVGRQRRLYEEFRLTTMAQVVNQFRCRRRLDAASGQGVENFLVRMAAREQALGELDICRQ